MYDSTIFDIDSLGQCMTITACHTLLSGIWGYETPNDQSMIINKIINPATYCHCCCYCWVWVSFQMRKVNPQSTTLCQCRLMDYTHHQALNEKTLARGQVSLRRFPSPAVYYHNKYTQVLVLSTKKIQWLYTKPNQQ